MLTAIVLCVTNKVKKFGLTDFRHCNQSVVYPTQYGLVTFHSN
jgi:hypothetical protein